MTDDPTPTVGIVTVTFNSAVVLPEFLDSIRAQRRKSVELRLYVVDNASTDDTLTLLEGAEDIPLVVIANDHNAGVAAGNNEGIIRALADDCAWVLLLNNDTVFGEDTLESLVASAVDHDASILAPFIAATDPPDTIWYAGGVIERRKALKPVHLGLGAPRPRRSEPVEPTDYASTCCLLVAPNVFHAVGLMDPTYFVYYDDQDFAMRCRERSFRYWYDPSITVFHKVSSLTGGKESSFSLRWMSRNRVVICRRHCSRVEFVLGMLYLQAWTWARWLTRRDSFAVFRLRQSSYLEGARVRLQAIPEVPEAEAG